MFDEVEEAKKRQVDRLYEKLDYNDDKASFHAAITQIVPLLRSMSDPYDTRVYRKIVYLSTESGSNWKKAECDDAIIRIG